MKTGLILEGGALRGIFTAGVLDAFLNRGIEFEYIAGVSAGAGNCANFLARQHGRAAESLTASGRDSYFGAASFLRSGKLINLDRMFFEYPYKQYPLDFETCLSSKTKAEYVVTCCETGEAEYLCETSDEKRLLTILKASCSIPLICPTVGIDGKNYLDGSIADSIPVARALEQGCDRVVVVLTKPEGGHPTDYSRYSALLEKRYPEYPLLVNACVERKSVYREQKSLLDRMLADGRALIIRPQVKMSRFEHDEEKMGVLYRDGVDQAERAFDTLETFLG